MTEAVPLSNAEQIIARIGDLQQLLQTANPGYESQLHMIHRALMADPDVIHILTPEQIGVIVQGLSKKKNVVIATKEAKNKGGKGGLKNIGLSDL
jgi:hypothetical protein